MEVSVSSVDFDTEDMIYLLDKWEAYGYLDGLLTDKHWDFIEGNPAPVIEYFTDQVQIYEDDKERLAEYGFDKLYEVLKGIYETV